MFDNTLFTLASAVADSGTVTVGYPSGKSRGSYDLTTGNHKLSVNGNLYSAPQDFTLTFNANASSITLTNASGVSWPVQAACRLQIERAGVDNWLKPVIPTSVYDRVTPMLPYLIDFGSPNILDADGYCVSQDLTTAGVFSSSVTVAAALAAAALAGVADVPRNVVAAWTGAAIITITGKDEFGTVIVEKSGSGTSFTGKKAFKQVTGIAVSANVTSLTVGTGDVLGLPVAFTAAAHILAELRNGVVIGRPPGKVRLNWFGEQVSVLAGTTSGIELIAPHAGYISGLTVAVRAAVTTGGTVTVKIGTTDVTGLTLTIADAATKGTTASDTPTTQFDSSTVVAKGDRIQIVFDNAFATAAALDGYIEITPKDIVSDGTLVPAVAAEATATTGDVRGTYDPADALDGNVGYKLLALLADPNYFGVTQYGG